MDWLESLLWDPASVAHIVCLYAFVISVGVLLGKIKIFGISLGVTFVLFTGILMGHFGFTGETHILHFIREFGLILFVFCIGLQVGPSFFSSFKKGGMTLNMLAVGIVVLNIAVALGIYFIDGGIDLPMMVGILYGAVTNTPGLGAAQEALNQLNYTGDPIALGYACAYPLGVVGIIGSIIAIRYICRVNLKKEEDELSIQTSDMKHMPHMLHLEVRNESIDGKKLLQIKEFMGRPFVCSRIRHDGHVSIPNQDTEFHIGDQVFIVCSEEDAEAVIAFIGKEIQVDWEKQDMPMVSRRILVTKSGTFYYSLYKVLTSFDTYTGKEKYDADLAQHQVGTHGCISHQLQFMSEPSDKNSNHQRTACQTELHRSRYARKSDRKTTQ